MKKFLVLLLVLSGAALKAQDQTSLEKHYQAFYKQMRVQGDINGIIQALTHLNVIAPNTARKATLA